MATASTMGNMPGPGFLADSLITGRFAQQPTGKESPFLFDNCSRNLMLDKMGLKAPKQVSTGTTIVACCFDGGVVMGADSRATAGNIIADKHCEKVHKITDHIYGCGAGTAADLDQVTRMLASNLKLIELNTGRKPNVITACRRAKQHLFRYMGYIGAYLLIGGVDDTGAYLFDVHAHGSSMAHQFAADGSGSYAAIMVLEKNFKPHMNRDQAIALVISALEAGMHADNMSGNSYNYVVIDKDGSKFTGPVVPAFSHRPDKNDLDYKFRKGATKVLKQKVCKYDVVESMDVE